MAALRSFIRELSLLTLFIFSYIESASIDKRFLTKSGFAQGRIVGTVTDHDIDEASGCAASRTHPGLLYTLNDHGDKAKIYVVATNGSLMATYDIEGADNNDWEDLAIGPCDASNFTQDCIYIADTGDSHNDNTIYRFEEPYFIENRDVQVEAMLRFSWSEPDCETIMVDPKANVYLISKEDDGQGKVYELPKSAWSRSSHSHRVSLPSSTSRLVSAPSTHHDPVGGDISPDGDEVLVKVHEGIYYWDMNGSRDYKAVISAPGFKTPYTQEHQGESVCWDHNGRGFYTMSEGRNQPIYYYARV